MPTKVRIIDVDEDREPVVQAELSIDFEDPRAVVEIISHLVDVVFPEPGEYRAQVLVAGDVIIERRLLLLDSGGTEQ